MSSSTIIGKFRRISPAALLTFENREGAAHDASCHKPCVSEWSGTGGAHGNLQRNILNFDADTGQRVTQSSILSEGSQTRWIEIAEIHFRQARKLTSAADLREEGLNFPGNRFQPNDRYAIGENPLTFFFVDYEIAPHSMGATNGEMPGAEIRDLLRPDS